MAEADILAAFPVATALVAADTATAAAGIAMVDAATAAVAIGVVDMAAATAMDVGTAVAMDTVAAGVDGASPTPPCGVAITGPRTIPTTMTLMRMTRMPTALATTRPWSVSLEEDGVVAGEVIAADTDAGLAVEADLVADADLPVAVDSRAMAAAGAALDARL
jgi:hypothetical protein